VCYYLGVDWADQTHAVWVVDESGAKITARTVAHTAEALTEWGRELDEWRAQGIALWAAIERPDGRVVDFLLDHGVVVYPVNPKALDRARDRFRQSGAKSDPFDARVLADFLRTDHAHLRALQPSSEAAQELKLLTEDCQRHIRQQTRLVNQLTAALKAYYPRALEVAEVTSALARAFLPAYPTPAALGARAEAAGGPDRRALDPPPATAIAGAGPRGTCEGAVDAGLDGAADARRGGGRPVPEGDRRFFREYAGGPVGADPADR
jgi:transposase